MKYLITECLVMLKEYSELRYSQSESMKGDLKNCLRTKAGDAGRLHDKLKEFLKDDMIMIPSNNEIVSGWYTCEKVPPKKNGFYSDKVLFFSKDTYHIVVFNHDNRNWYKVHDTRYVWLEYNPEEYYDCIWMPFPGIPKSLDTISKDNNDDSKAQALSAMEVIVKYLSGNPIMDDSPRLKDIIKYHIDPAIQRLKK
jgi:hypothetical protein